MNDIYTFECKSWRTSRATFHPMQATCIIDGRYYTMPSRAYDLSPGIQSIHIARRSSRVRPNRILITVVFVYAQGRVSIGPLRRRFILQATLTVQRRCRWLSLLRARLLAVTMGCHPVLGANAHLRAFAGCPELLHIILSDSLRCPPLLMGVTRFTPVRRIIARSWRIVAACLDVTYTVIQNITDLFSSAS
jgi:hypothetical protein